MAKNMDMHGDEIIGTGSGLINPNSKDFQILRKKILEHSASLSEEQKIQTHILGIKFQMERYYSEGSLEEIRSTGSFLKELVDSVGVSHKGFAEYIGYKNSNLSAIYSGSRRMNHDLALKLGSIFGIPASLWLNLQNKVELLKIRQGKDKQYGDFQLKDLIQKAS